MEQPARPVRRKRPLPWLEPGILTGSLVPLALLIYQAFTRGLGANPIAEALNRVGLLALVLLVACLTCTPLKIWFGWNWPIRVRRLIGLLAFGYACLHFLIYAGLDQQLDIPAILTDIAKRPFILVGFLAWLLLIPLAVTSTQKALQRLGFRRWKALHRVVYVCAGLGVVHFLWRVKKDTTEPMLYAAVLAVLFATRALSTWNKRRQKELKELARERRALT
jgi:methionine sulfoxide reductase heme-binding subunit